MNQTVKLQELALVVAVNNHNPSILTIDFLKYSGIIPSDWQPATPPNSSNRTGIISFTNGITLVAEPNRIIFVEAITEKPTASIEIPFIASRYIEKLPNIEYIGAGINIKGHVALNTSPDSARKYIQETLLSPGAWLEVDNAPVNATINLTYTLERCLFNLSIMSATLREQDETTTPIVLFNGTFSYEQANPNLKTQLKDLQQVFDNWQTDVKTYCDIINNKFLNQIASATTIVPNIFAINTSS